jgi:hypothetical protein
MSYECFDFLHRFARVTDSKPFQLVGFVGSRDAAVSWDASSLARRYRNVLGAFDFDWRRRITLHFWSGR